MTKLVLPMPCQVRRLWPVFRIARQEKVMAVEVGELLAGDAFFDELISVDDPPAIIADRPQATVELPVGVLAEGETVARVVVAAVAELVNVRGVHNALHLLVAERGHPVACQRARVFVGDDDDFDAETGIASALDGRESSGFRSFSTSLDRGADGIASRERAVLLAGFGGCCRESDRVSDGQGVPSSRLRRQTDVFAGRE